MMFQGVNKKNDYFEGWYFKNVSADSQRIIAFIPGIALSNDENESHAFIQFFNGKEMDYRYFEYPLDSFDYSKEQFNVAVGQNDFSLSRVHLDIEEGEFSLKGDLSYENLAPLPKKFMSPNIMGFFTYIPFMQAKHGIGSMNHNIRGTLKLNDRKFDFSGGKGYIEKDYGSSFPSSYIWMQSNHFQTDDASFMLSVATIPLLGLTFLGYLSVFYLNGKFYRFATYARSEFKDFSKEENRVMMKKGHSWELLFDETGENSGLEIMDEKDEIASQFI